MGNPLVDFKIDPYTVQLSEIYCKKIFELNGTYNFKDLRSKFLELSKEYHPDINPSFRQKYLLISRAYEYLLELLNNKTLKPLKTDTKSPLKYKLLQTEPTILKYYVYVDWFEVLSSWNKNKPFLKKIKYNYTAFCDCEQLCFYCKGCGFIESSITCSYCKGHGLTNYCNQCSKQGIYLKKDQIVLEIPLGVVLPTQLILAGKGNTNSLDLYDRGPLILVIGYTKNTKLLKKHIFIHEVPIRPSALKNNHIEIYFDEETSFKINVSEIKQIPFYKQLKLKDLTINNQKLKLYLKLILNLQIS